jgi:phosphatidate phosphatase APP1
MGPHETTRMGSSVARLSLLLTVALAVPAWSQVQSGRIVGTVRDAQQATVAKATVTVTSSATGQSSNVTTNDRGDYVVTPVDPGVYRVSVALDG